MTDGRQCAKCHTTRRVVHVGADGLYRCDNHAQRVSTTPNPSTSTALSRISRRATLAESGAPALTLASSRDVDALVATLSEVLAITDRHAAPLGELCRCHTCDIRRTIDDRLRSTP